MPFKRAEIGKQEGPQYLTVCTYGPGGNYVGQKPHVNDEAKSECPAGKTCLNNFGAASADKLSTGFYSLHIFLLNCFIFYTFMLFYCN